MSNLRDFLTGRRAEVAQELASANTELNFLVHRTNELHMQISNLRHEMVQLEKAALAIGLNFGEEQKEENTLGPRYTIKKAVLAVLSEVPNGLSALDLLYRINTPRFKLSIKRESLSPQLSRLKQEGKIELHGQIWKLDRTNEEGPDQRSEPSGG